MKRRHIGAFVLAVFVATRILVACASSGNGNSNNAAPSNSPTTLNVLAGSETKDLLPILDDARKKTGVTVNLTYTGSLDGAERIADGSAGDAALFASDKYVALASAASKVLVHQSIMHSPVVVGVKDSVATKLGWAGKTVGWKDIAAAAANEKFRFAMTSPAASNSGFSALVGVATALAGNQALDAKTIDANALKGFFVGQSLTSGSSGFLADAFVGSQDRLDGIVNYESVLMGLNSGGKLHEKLDLVYPDEGIVTADYPLMLLNGDKRAAYDKLVAYLRQPDVQRRIEADTSRRPAVPGVALSSKFTQRLLVEAPFPANLAVVQTLLDDYQNTLRRPAHPIYVLDTSGSMDGSRLDHLKEALRGLAGSDTSFTGHFARFSPRETVDLITFSNQVGSQTSYAIDSTDPNSQGLTGLRDFVDGLRANGGTAIYSALDAAYQAAANIRKTDAESVISIVLMTDGENNAGESSNRFLQSVQSRPAGVQDVRVFSVLFGEADPAALHQIADATGGKVFDARQASLSSVFKEIRGYQ